MGLRIAQRTCLGRWVTAEGERQAMVRHSWTLEGLNLGGLTRERRRRTWSAGLPVAVRGVRNWVGGRGRLVGAYLRVGGHLYGFWIHHRVELVVPVPRGMRLAG